ncbi:MAG: PQQ-dependent sugar dehydrogenase [Phycisphaerales bacterium]
MKTRSTLLAGVGLSLLLVPLAPAQQAEEWISGGLERPVDFVADPTNPQRFYVVEQTGQIRVIEDDELLEEPFFEIDRTDFTTDNWEQGLLGMTLDPGFADNHRFYLDYSGKDGRTIIARFTAQDEHHASFSSREVLLEIAQPWGNHNGGCLRFGPDKMLYIGMGDGGSANDPKGNGQNLGVLLAKILRIDVTGAPDEGKKYAVPKDNPFLKTEGARPEIWAYGVRNPWRLEFDSKGRLWIADVGQNRFEWVHVQHENSKGGENYGWSVMEGKGRFNPGREKYKDPPRLDQAAFREKGMQFPVFEYRHHPVASITGGYLYEGKDVPSLKNRYILADFMSGRVWSFKLGDDWEADDVVEHTDAFAQTFGGDGPGLAISSFGRDLAGELYMLDYKRGRVLKIVE